MDRGGCHFGWCSFGPWVSNLKRDLYAKAETGTKEIEGTLVVEDAPLLLYDATLVRRGGMPRSLHTGIVDWFMCFGNGAAEAV